VEPVVADPVVVDSVVVDPVVTDPVVADPGVVSEGEVVTEGEDDIGEVEEDIERNYYFNPHEYSEEEEEDIPEIRS
jgi:hypothetical protein